MINILAIRCSLAFAPYFLESAVTFLQSGETTSQVVRQAANGFILRFEGGLWLRHQNREAALDKEAANHFCSTVSMREGFYDVARKTDEVVFASVGQSLLLSHPQSEMWLDRGVIPSLLAAFSGTSLAGDETLPDWLNISGGDGRLLLSDQRSGRWVLLGADHFAEFERRYELLIKALELPKALKPPTISLKGLQVHLQSAFKLAESFEEFAQSGTFTPFEEVTPTYQLLVMRATEGMKISDSHSLAAVTAKESPKWAAMIRAEMERYQARQVDRDQIRTVLANTEQGHWLMQWGDEVFVSKDEWNQLKALKAGEVQTARLTGKRDDDFLVVLEKANGNCVALTEAEISYL